MPRALRARAVVRLTLLAASTLASCTEAVATAPSGRVPAPLDSSITITVLPDRATTLQFPAAPGTGIYLDVSASGGAARVLAGDATRPLLQATVGVDPVRGPVRSATIAAGRSGGVQVAVLPPLPNIGVASGPTQVTIRAHADTSFDAKYASGRVLAGVRYGTAKPGCTGFGYADLTAPVIAVIMARSNIVGSMGATFYYDGPAGIANLSNDANWRPVAGVDSLDLAQGAAVYSILTSGRWGLTACDNGGESRFELAYVHTTPETLPGTGVFGDTIVGERIDVPGDTDIFTVPLPANADTFFVALAGGDRPNTRLTLTVIDPCCFLGTTSRGSGTPLLSNTTPMILGSSIGRTQVVISVTGAGALGALNRGPYRFAVIRGPSYAPEIAARALAVGDTVRTETLWATVDIDDFTLTTPPNTDITVQLRKLVDVGLPSQLALELANGGRGQFKGGTVVLDTAASGVVRFPLQGVSGQTLVRINSPDRSYLGGYEVVILAGIVP